MTSPPANYFHLDWFQLWNMIYVKIWVILPFLRRYCSRGCLFVVRHSQGECASWRKYLVEVSWIAGVPMSWLPGKRERQGAPTSNGGKYGDCREHLSYVQQYPAVAIIAGTQSDARARISNDQDFALTRPRYLAAGSRASSFDFSSSRGGRHISPRGGCHISPPFLSCELGHGLWPALAAAAAQFSVLVSRGKK